MQFIIFLKNAQLITKEAKSIGRIMANISKELENLLEIKALLNEAIKSQKRSDKCNENYIARTNRAGFSRAVTTSFNASASHNAAALKSDMKVLKDAFLQTFNIDLS